MMDDHEIRSAALGHAIAAYGHVQEGSPIGEQQEHVLSLAILYHTYIAEGGTEALRMVGVETADPAPVLQLVTKVSFPPAADGR